jgi:hypothetical protein
MVAVALDRSVRAGDEDLAEGKWVLHDLQGVLFTRVGDVLEG